MDMVFEVRESFRLGTDLLVRFAAAPDAGSIDAVVGEVSRLCSILEALRLKLLRFAGVGDRSVLSASLGLSRGEVAQLERSVVRLAGMARLQEAMESGVVSASKARIVADAVRSGRQEAALTDEAQIVAWATSLAPSALARELDRWGREVDARSGEPTGDHLRKARSLEFMRRSTGMVAIVGELDPESAEIVQIAVDAKSRQEWVDEPAAEHGSRSHTQRRVDALVGICGDWLAGVVHETQPARSNTDRIDGFLNHRDARSGAEGRETVADPEKIALLRSDPGDRPQTSASTQSGVVVGPDRAVQPGVAAGFYGRDGNAYAAPRAVPQVGVIVDLSTLRDADGVAVTERGSVLDAETAKRLACDCGVSRVLMNGPSAVLDVGREERVVKGPLRKAIVLRDRCCRWSGCNAPANRTQAHHATHWASGGATNMSNCALFCSRHHHLLHEGGWRLSGNANDSLTFTSPDGTRVLTSAPPGYLRKDAA